MKQNGKLRCYRGAMVGKTCSAFASMLPHVSGLDYLVRLSLIGAKNVALGRRFTREDWVTVAEQVLVTSGIDDVKVDNLAKRMKVTRGSFYWHFEDREALLDALLDNWRRHNLREIEQISTRWATTPPDFIEVVRIWLGEDPIVPQIDTAIRAWARKSPHVARLVHETDEAWVSLLKNHFRRMGMGPDESLVRARIVYFHQIGYYALAMQEDLEERIRLAPFYSEVLTGERSSPEQESVLRSLLETKRKSRSGGTDAKPTTPVRRKPPAKPS